MTQDEIIEIAKTVCDFSVDSRGRMDFLFDEYGLEAFVKAIRARGKQEIWPFPRKVIFDDHIMPKFNPDNEEDALL